MERTGGGGEGGRGEEEEERGFLSERKSNFAPSLN